jgi:hypothetical protein
MVGLQSRASHASMRFTKGKFNFHYRFRVCSSCELSRERADVVAVTHNEKPLSICLSINCFQFAVS